MLENYECNIRKKEVRMNEYERTELFMLKMSAE